MARDYITPYIALHTTPNPSYPSRMPLSFPFRLPIEPYHFPLPQFLFQVIHAVLPDGSTVKGVEVFRRVYECVFPFVDIMAYAFIWRHVHTCRTHAFRPIPMHLLPFTSQGDRPGLGLRRCVQNTILCPRGFTAPTPLSHISPPSTHTNPTVTKLPLVGSVADAAYDLWAVNRLRITGRPELEEILKERQAKIKGTNYDDCSDECEIKW